MVLLQHHPPRPVFYVVKQRDGQTLQSIITSHGLPGTRIWSDEWRAYRNLNQLGYIHETVNHSRHLIHPVTGEPVCFDCTMPSIVHITSFFLTGVHTNDIEGAWMWAKRFMHNRKVQSDIHLHMHLQSYMWRMWKRQPHPGGCFLRLLDDIAVLYDFMTATKNIYRQVCAIYKQVKQ